MSIPFNVFDIETKPLPALVTRFTDPFPDFNEADVKCGNIKDPVKIAEKLASEKAKHETERLAYWAKAMDEAALHPFTGSVLCIGIMGDEGSHTILEGDERTILIAFWHAFSTHADSHRKWVFWSGSGNGDENFDPDFIVTRSRILGVSVPSIVRQGNGRYYSERLVDLAKVFLLNKRNAYCRLTKAADLCGLYESTKGTDQAIIPKTDADVVQGKNFHEWWDGKASPEKSAAEQRDFAAGYLLNDLRHTRHLALRFL